MKTLDPVTVQVSKEYVSWMQGTFRELVAHSDPTKCKLHPEGKFTVRADEVRPGIWEVVTPEGQRCLFTSWLRAMSFVVNGMQLRFSEYLLMQAEEMWRA